MVASSVGFTGFGEPASDMDSNLTGALPNDILSVKIKFTGLTESDDDGGGVD